MGVSSRSRTMSREARSRFSYCRPTSSSWQPSEQWMFTVFLVDDDPGVLKALSRLLRARGYDVQGFASPQEFLRDHEAAPPGCAVLDVSMPGLDGLELQRAMTAAGIQRPIIFITGKGDIPTTVRAM